MEQLPQELLRVIIDVLAPDNTNASREVLKTFQLVSKDCADAAAGVLFRQIPVWISRVSLENLKAVSEHPVISQHVREILFAPLRFVKGNIDELVVKVLARRAHLEILQERCAKYRFGLLQYWRDQALLAQDGQDLQMVTQALQILPNMNSIRIGPSLVGSADIGESLGAGTRRELSNNGEYTLPLLFRAMANAGTCLQSFTLDNSAKYVRPGGLSWLPALESRLSGLSSSAVCKAVDALGDKRSMVFGAVKSFQVPCFCTSKFSHEEIQNALSAVNELLAGCQNIDHFSLNVIHSGEVRTLTEVIPPEMPVRQSKLRTLDTGHMKASAMEIFSWIGLSCQTLETVYLYFVLIRPPDDWSVVLNLFRTLEFDRLQSFRLFGCDGSETAAVSVQVESYIKKLTDEDPIAQRLKLIRESRGIADANDSSESSWHTESSDESSFAENSEISSDDVWSAASSDETTADEQEDDTSTFSSGSNDEDGF
ncbi:uncharacterized protein KY384_004700 [Bacidia gigantensis]|uniref:uncharacterized protein n=1 Tax=Bacidia gigantensis TaxID=2732470 RepID=UPI001D0463AD|nr:uncharacterized protein KY384_004700 [Bacidia gigantensis]KAG8530200.1 hypothetical protein KY384_004700 [Bacidia gigantensis]